MIAIDNKALSVINLKCFQPITERPEQVRGLFQPVFFGCPEREWRNSSLDLLLPINQSATAAKNVTRVYEILVRHIHSRVRMEHQYSC